jgi:S1-C subfamily serine protease
MNKKIALSLVAVVLTVTMAACQLSSYLGTPTPSVAPTPTTSTSLPNPQPASLANQQDQLVALYQAVSPGVVTVQTSNALGSGWVYSSDGYIVTNQHVVSTAKQVEVDFPSGTKVYGTVVGSDPNTDLAVIKVDVPADQLDVLPLGDSDQLQIGQTVVAIGDPLTVTLNGSMTTGIISGLGRSEDSNVPTAGGSYYAAGDFVETDALLNHGNSGGPLLNLSGQVVGVARSIQVDPSTGLPSGLGFAISVNVVKRVVPQLIQTGKFDFPYLGISTIDTLPLDVINQLGLKSNTGAYVTNVVPGGPCGQAGIQAGTQPSSVPNLNSGGDLIIAVDGQPVQVFADLIRYLVLNKSPGDTITLTILRGSQQLDVPITLGVRPTQ